MKKRCARITDLSAYLDEQLGRRKRARVQAHLARCPACAATLAKLQALRTDLRALPEPTLGFDLGSVIEGRLAALPRPAHGARRRAWRPLIPVGIGAAASLSFGLLMGLGLTAGSAYQALPAATMMAVFDPVAPGSLCLANTCRLEGLVK